MRLRNSIINVFSLLSFLLIVNCYQVYSQSISNIEKIRFFREKHIALHQNQQTLSKGIFSATVKSIDGSIVKFLEDNLVVDVSKATIKEDIFGSTETFPMSIIKPGMFISTSISDIPSSPDSPLVANSILIPSRKKITIFRKSIEGVDLTNQTITLFNLSIQLNEKTKIFNQQNKRLELKDLKAGQSIQANLQIEQGIVTSDSILISSQKADPSFPSGIVSAVVSSVKDNQINIFEDKIQLDFSKAKIGTLLSCEVPMPIINIGTSLSFPFFGDCPKRSQGLKVVDSEINSFDEITFDNATIQNLDLTKSSITIFNRPILITKDTKITKSSGKRVSIEKLKANKNVLMTAQIENGKVVAKSISILKKSGAIVFFATGKVCDSPNLDLTCD